MLPNQTKLHAAACPPRNSQKRPRNQDPSTILQENHPNSSLLSAPFFLGFLFLSFFFASCLPSRAINWQTRLQTMTRTKENKRLRIRRCCHHQCGVKTNPETRKGHRISVRGQDRSTSSSYPLPAISGRRSGRHMPLGSALVADPSSVYRVRGLHLCGILTNPMGCEITKRVERM